VTSRSNPGRESAGTLAGYCVVTVVALRLVWGAIDDITTDNSTDFRPEYVALIACGGWLTLVAVRLLRGGRLLLGGLSVAALVAGVWAQRVIRPGGVPEARLESAVVIAAYFWFVAVAVNLGWRAWRQRARRVTATP